MWTYGDAGNSFDERLEKVVRAKHRVATKCEPRIPLPLEHRCRMLSNLLLDCCGSSPSTLLGIPRSVECLRLAEGTGEVGAEHHAPPVTNYKYILEEIIQIRIPSPDANSEDS